MSDNPTPDMAEAPAGSHFTASAHHAVTIGPDSPTGEDGLTITAGQAYKSTSGSSGDATISIPDAAEAKEHGKISPSPVSSCDSEDGSPIDKETSRFESIKAAPTKESQKQKRPDLAGRRTITTEDDLFRTLSQRHTSASGRSEAELEEEHAEIEKLMSRMFGKARQAHSEEEKTRHSGVIFKNLTVKGVGLGASLQPTVGDIFLGLPRTIKNLISKGPKAASGKPPVRTLLNNFDGCVRPGELLLVLGRPGSGCTTFLKAFTNQRSGFEAVEGDVTYGGTDAKRMAKDFRGEVIYNPEDDLHYATLTVKRTLRFALQTRTPGKESRLEGESRADYMSEFLRVVTKLFWIGKHHSCSQSALRY